MRGQLPGSPKPSEKKGEKNKTDDSMDELELLLDRSHTCPVCGCEFSTKDVKAGKAQSDGMDLDLRPRYRNIDALKYRMTECPLCSYADFDKFFSNVNKRTLPALKERMIMREVENLNEEFPRRYPDAYRYSKSALRCCLISGSKPGKRAYTALFSSWILRGWRESLKRDGLIVSDTDTMSMVEEGKLKKYALRNFRLAETTEEFPIMGMSEPTFDYLMGVLCYEQEELNDAAKYILRALQDRNLKPNIRTNAEDLRDMIRDRKHAVKAAKEG